jgi:hypothetical protein
LTLALQPLAAVMNRQGWEPLNVLQYIEWIDDQRQFNSDKTKMG